MKTSVRIHRYELIHTNNFSAHPHLLAWPGLAGKTGFATIYYIYKDEC